MAANRPDKNRIRRLGFIENRISAKDAMIIIAGSMKQIMINI
jgi:hypothetical protein